MNRFLINWSGCLDWTDLHSGQYHSFWPFAKRKRQSWQKVWPQESAIRTGGLKISFLVQNIIFNENDQNCTVKMSQSYDVGDKIHKFEVFLGICHQHVNLVTNVLRLTHPSRKLKKLPQEFYGGNIPWNLEKKFSTPNFGRVFDFVPPRDYFYLILHIKKYRKNIPTVLWRLVTRSSHT